MDPEKPKNDDRSGPPAGKGGKQAGPARHRTGSAAEGKPGSARDRADSLTRPKGDSGAGKGPDSPEPATGSRPRSTLSEKQRIEARERRRSRRRPVEGNPLSKGIRATAREIRHTFAFVGNGIIAGLAALGPVFSSVGMGLVWLVEAAGKGLVALVDLLRRAVAALGRALISLDRVITPRGALLMVAAIGAVLLGVSQFRGLGMIEIGQPGYVGIEDLVRAPAIDRTTPAGVHTNILVPIAGIGLLAVVVIALGSLSSLAGRIGRWRRLASMVLVAIGLLTLVVAVLVDLPRATDTSEAALAYSGVTATLLSGFWIEIGAGATLAVAGLALMLEPTARPARERRRRRRRHAAIAEGRA